jgi:hypothetical protein
MLTPPRHLIPSLVYPGSVFVGMLTPPRHLIPPLVYPGSVFVGMLTPPRHLIPPLIYPQVRICHIPWFVFPSGLMSLMTVRDLCNFTEHHSFYPQPMMLTRRNLSSAMNKLQEVLDIMGKKILQFSWETSMQNSSLTTHERCWGRIFTGLFIEIHLSVGVNIQ